MEVYVKLTKRSYEEVITEILASGVHHALPKTRIMQSTRQSSEARDRLFDLVVKNGLIRKITNSKDSRELISPSIEYNKTREYYMTTELGMKYITLYNEIRQLLGKPRIISNVTPFTSKA